MKNVGKKTKGGKSSKKNKDQSDSRSKSRGGEEVKEKKKKKKDSDDSALVSKGVKGVREDFRTRRGSLKEFKELERIFELEGIP